MAVNGSVVLALCVSVEPGDDFDEFVRAEWPSLVRSVTVIVGGRQAAEDIVQDAFAKAFARWRLVRTYDRPGAWARRVAIRDAVRARKRQARRAALERSHAAGTWPVIGAPEVDGWVSSALAELTPQQRACVVLRYLDGFDNREIAELLGCSSATVGVHLHRAKARLAAFHQEVIHDDVRH